MSDSPEVEEFRRRIEELRKHPLLRSLVRGQELHFGSLTRNDVNELLRDETAYYFLTAAAGLNRTALKRAMETEAARIVPQKLRRAYAVKEHLPKRAIFRDVANSAVVLRRGDIARKDKGAVEALFRERLEAENIPILMSPPLRHVPGILIGRRKPDGVYPDPETGAPPLVYLEIKNVRRVSDDIQKRLYEVAEASLEMKFLYGRLSLQGMRLRSTRQVLERTQIYREKLREQIRMSSPIVVVLLLCSREEAGRYRDGAEAFVDKVFFQEEISECLQFLKNAISGSPTSTS